MYSEASDGAAKTVTPLRPVKCLYAELYFLVQRLYKSMTQNPMKKLEIGFYSKPIQFYQIPNMGLLEEMDILGGDMKVTLPGDESLADITFRICEKHANEFIQVKIDCKHRHTRETLVLSVKSDFRFAVIVGVIHFPNRQTDIELKVYYMVI
ncbi:Hypothetical predicted protein [Octopus vulgaris]|uniref:Uncharacterized protein n=1 Tax=Octopus vulgaris TaxID=6645 RepID=A0AA36B3C3_OCTVU|nr:Hypothetical predicted protein [Octopus vulgaris]